MPLDTSPNPNPPILTVTAVGFAAIVAPQLPEGTWVNNTDTNQVWLNEYVAGVLTLVLKGGGGAGGEVLAHFSGVGPYAIGTAATLNIFSPTAGARVANLPTLASAVAGRLYKFQNQDPGGSTIALTPNGAETINGVAAAYVMATSTMLIKDTTLNTWVRFGTG